MTYFVHALCLFFSQKKRMFDIWKQSGGFVEAFPLLLSLRAWISKEAANNNVLLSWCEYGIFDPFRVSFCYIMRLRKNRKVMKD